MAGTSDPYASSGVGVFLIHPGENDREERAALLAHLKDAHPNLFGHAGPAAGSGFGTPMPEIGANELPLAYLVAIHDANHMGLYRDHDDDDWIVRSQPAPQE